MPLIVIWRGSTGLNETAESPEWNFDMEVSCVRKFRGPHALCLSTAPLKGAIGTGAQAGMLVWHSNVVRAKGGIGVLTIEWQGPAGGILPPDEAGIEPEKVERGLMHHPRYATFVPSGHDSDYRDAIKVAMESTDADKVVNAEAFIDTSDLASELYEKLQRGHTHYEISAPVFVYTTHSWTAPTSLHVGGVKQTPPGIPLGPPGTDWLRLADRVSWNGSMWTVERRWMGGPDLDTDIYPPG